MNILFTINRSYIAQMQSCVRSISRFLFKENCDIYILHQKLLPEDIAAIQKQETEHLHYHFINLDKQNFQDFPNTLGYPDEMYFRLMAASVLPVEMERILYLDPDIVVIHPLDELYNMDFENNYFIGTTHVDKTLTRINASRLDLNTVVPYINTGVLLMNLNALRKCTDLTKEIEIFVSSHKKSLRLPDQDIITALFGDKVKLVDPMIYNLSDRVLAFHNMKNPSSMRDYDWVRENTVIIHYCGKNKPWNNHYLGILKPFYDEVNQ